MIYCIDTEFMVSSGHPLLLSLGIAAADGRTYYAETNADLSKANQFVRQQVVPLLTGPIKTETEIKKDILNFVYVDPEWWGYYCTFDFYLLLMLFGGFEKFPWKPICHDIMTLKNLTGVASLPFQVTPEHHALNDAIWTRDCLSYLQLKLGDR